MDQEINAKQFFCCRIFKGAMENLFIFATKTKFLQLYNWKTFKNSWKSKKFKGSRVSRLKHMVWIFFKVVYFNWKTFKKSCKIKKVTKFKSYKSKSRRITDLKHDIYHFFGGLLSIVFPETLLAPPHIFLGKIVPGI